MASASMASACMTSACVASVCVAAPITHLVSVEVIKGLVSTFRMWTSVAVMRIETVINVAVEVVGAVEPRADSDEHAAVKPLGSVVPVGGAVVRGEVVVAAAGFRAERGPSDAGSLVAGCSLHADGDRRRGVVPISELMRRIQPSSRRMVGQEEGSRHLAGSGL